MNINSIAKKYEDFKTRFKRHSYIQITDNSRFEVDYCKGVTLYDENIIKLVTAKNNISIIGTELKMRNFSTDGVIIYGKIKELEFNEYNENENEKNKYNGKR